MINISNNVTDSYLDNLISFLKGVALGLIAGFIVLAIVIEATRTDYDETWRTLRWYVDDQCVDRKYLSKEHKDDELIIKFRCK